MSFIAIDLTFMVLFTLAVVLFLYTRKHNLQRQGLMYLYRTKLGLKLIEKTSIKYEKILRPMQYVILAMGYLLMISIVILIVYTVYIYLRYPVTDVIKAPPLLPLLPYFPELFNLESFFPPFYFTYFLVALGIVATVHEFAHGIFARLNKIGIHSTGFAFLGPILGAFVEQDDKQMNKSSKFAQLSVLGAGVFANMVMTVLFLILIWLFFLAAFVPAGVTFTNYATTVLNVSEVTHVQGQLFSTGANITLPANATFITLTAYNKTFHTNPVVLERTLERGLPYIGAYDDSPAFKAQLAGAITSIDGTPIHSLPELTAALRSHRPGDTVEITTLNKGVKRNYTVTLADRNGTAYLGIGSGVPRNGGVMAAFGKITPKMNNPITAVNYESKLGEFGIFIFNLLWWVMTINFLVALFNMLPLGILDGGRFFLLSVWGATGSKKAGERAYVWTTRVIMFLFVALMAKWLYAIAF